MAKVSTNISLDKELKKQAQELFADFGLDLTTGITLFLKQAVREQKIPFEIKREAPAQVRVVKQVVKPVTAAQQAERNAQAAAKGEDLSDTKKYMVFDEALKALNKK